MNPFRRLHSTAVPLIRDNIDTDAIIPSREMKTVSKTGLADGLFAGWRYRSADSRDPDPNFVLNDPSYAGAQILLGGANFGCGSSREHAVWALAEFGFRAIIAESFSPIFRSNCIRNGVLPVELDARSILVADGPLTVDLEELSVIGANGHRWPFSIDDEAREMLLGGLDAIDLTLQRQTAIGAFRDRDRTDRPWAYLSGQIGSPDNDAIGSRA